MRPSVRRAAARLAVPAAAAALLVPLAETPSAAAATPLAETPLTVLAGNGVGDGGQATDALIVPNSLTYAPDGDLLVVEAKRLRRVDSATGIVTTIAGTGEHGVSPDGTQASEAKFVNLRDAAVAADGTIYVVDWHRLRRIGTDGVLTTVAEVAEPVSVAVSPVGQVYVASPVTVWRHSAQDGLQVVAGAPGATQADYNVPDARTAKLGYLMDMAFTNAGHLLLAETDTKRVRRIAGGAIGAPIVTIAGTPAIQVGHPRSLAVRADDAVVIGAADAVHLLANAGATTPGPVTRLVQSYCIDHVAAGPGGAVGSCLVWPDGWSVRSLPGSGSFGAVLAGSRFSADGAPAAGSWFQDLRDVAAASDGTIYVVETDSLRAIGADGLLDVVAGTNADGPRSGDGGPASAAVFADMRQAAPAPDGSVYVSDGPYVRRVVPGGNVTAVAGGGTAFAEGGQALGTDLGGDVTGLAVDPNGALYAVTSCKAFRIMPGGTIHALAAPPCTSAPFGIPPAYLPDVAVDAAGRPLVTTIKTTGGTVYRIDPADTLQALDSAPFGTGIAVLPSGSIETTLTSLRPDGSWMRQRYMYNGVPQSRLRLAAEPAGTLLAHDPDRLYRATPPDQVLPPAVTGLQVTPGPGTLTLTWDASVSQERTGHVVRVSRGANAPGSPTVGDGGVTVDAGTFSVTLDRAAVVDGYPGLREEPYSVAVFARGNGGTAAPATATATPQPETTPPGTGSGLTLAVSDGMLNALWTKPADTDYYRSVARLAPDAVASPSAGTAPFSSGGQIASWSIASLAEGTYTVTVFQEDLYGNRSEPLTGTVFVDKTPPAAVTGLKVFAINGATRIRATWNAAAADVKHVRPRLLTGYSFPETPEQSAGEPITSTATSAEWPVTYYGAQHRVAVFTTDVAGNTARATFMYIPRRPAALAIATPGAVRYGWHATIRGSLASPTTGSGFHDQRVELWARPRVGTTAYRFVAATKTDRFGRVSFAHVPRADIVYQLRHPASTVAAVASAPRIVGVVPEVNAEPSDRSLAPGQAFSFTASMIPSHVGTPLTLQRYYSGAWRDVLTATTARDGIARFAVRAPGDARHAPVPRAVPRRRGPQGVGEHHLAGGGGVGACPAGWIVEVSGS